MALVQITVVVDNEQFHQLTEIVSLLEEAGMLIDQVLESLGVVTGAIDAADIAAIENIEGITIERQRDVGTSSLGDSSLGDSSLDDSSSSDF